jgi:hypothetical protein
MTEHLKIKKNKKFKYMTTLEKAKLWLSDTFDAETRATVQNWIDTNSPELEDSFYKVVIYLNFLFFLIFKCSVILNAVKRNEESLKIDSSLHFVSLRMINR